MSETIETGDPPADDLRVEVAVDRDEAAFEEGAKGREARELEKKLRRALQSRAQDREQMAAMQRRLAELEAAQHKGRLTGLEADIEAAEREAEQAIAEGDAQRAAKANRRMAELAAQRKAAEYEAPSAPQTGPAPEVQDWLAENRWFNPAKPDPKTKLALIAHSEAVEVEGLAANTPEYFRYIEQRVEAKFPGTVARGEDDGDEDPAPQQPARRTAAGPAPVSARTAPVRGATAAPMRIKPTAEQIQAARDFGQPIEKYMAEVVRLERAGRIGKENRR